MFFSIDKLITRKVWHAAYVLLNFFLFKIWNGNFSQINNQESFDFIPIFNIFFSLSNPFEHFLLLASFPTLWLKCSFDSEFTLRKFHVKLSFGAKLFNSDLLSDITGFLLSNCCHERLQVHNFSFNPVSDMFEWIL